MKVSKAEYTKSINTIQDYIDKHLDQDLTLEHLAREVNLSPFYFHRLFGYVTGEPLYSYIKRNRLEKAAFMLANTEKDISDIAMDVGFSSASSFAKAFKHFYGVSASVFRRSQNHSDYKTSILTDEEFFIRPHHISIKTFEACDLYYIRHIGPYKGDLALFQRLIGKLIAWTQKSELKVTQDKLYAIYHDQGSHTPDDKMRLTLAVQGDKGERLHKQLGEMTFKGGKYGVGRFIMTHNDFSAAWNYMLFQWLPESGFAFGEGLPFEYYTSTVKTSQGKIIVDICIPVK